jgi:hypothetical protein
MREGSMREGSMREGSMREGSMREGSMREGSMRDGNMSNVGGSKSLKVRQSVLCLLVSGLFVRVCTLYTVSRSEQTDVLSVFDSDGRTAGVSHACFAREYVEDTQKHNRSAKKWRS